VSGTVASSSTVPPAQLHTGPCDQPAEQERRLNGTGDQQPSGSATPSDPTAPTTQQPTALTASSQR
jgi:hypothetical protein